MLRLLAVIWVCNVGHVPQVALHLYLLDDGAEGVGYHEDHDGQADYENDAGGENVFDILQRESIREVTGGRREVIPCRCRHSSRWSSPLSQPWLRPKVQGWSSHSPQ